MADPSEADQQAQRDLAQRLAELGFVLPGSVVRRFMRCGKASCRCHATPPQLHGPYLQWTRTVAGKTVTRLLSEEQLGTYQPWFDNARQLRAIVSDLEALSIGVVERDTRERRRS